MTLSKLHHHRQHTLTRLLTQESEVAKIHHNQDPPPPGSDEATMTHWLARLKLLYGVPFHYMVADNRMLPSESIRFFEVDPNWIYSLVDGAYSPGRETEVDTVHDTVISRHLHHKVHQACREIRAQLMGKPKAKPCGSTPDGIPPISGFLLRSQLVSGWPGMEVIGYSDAAKTQIAPTLRFEHLNSDIILCLFEGIAHAVTLQEPGENIHFGISASQASDADTLVYQKQLCEVFGDNIGQKIPAPSGMIPIEWSDQEGLVVNIAGMASSMSTIINNDFNPNNTPFTSAQFGIEMVNGVDSVTITQGS